MGDIVLCDIVLCVRQWDEQKSFYGVIKLSKLEILY